MSKKKNILGYTNLFDKSDGVDRIILNLARKRKQIIYGARSIQAQNNLFARNTKDYDILSNNPKKSANELQRMLDKLMKTDQYYSKPAMHKGTFKVMSKGYNQKKGDEDDESVADYTEMPKPSPPTITKRGIRFRILKEELKAKAKAVADPEFEFRHKKDQDDINRIKGYLKVKNIIKGRGG